MRLPDFLIIGAMKCGTTSLYSDLRSNSSVFLPEEKEPMNLASDDVLEESGRRTYARLFRPATDDQVCGEASTGYSKLPDVEGVPRRARELLGPDLRIIYLIREPVARVISHHYFELARGEMDVADIDEAIHQYPRLIDYGRYAMQLEPWLESFGEGNFMVERFEDYVRDRRGRIAEICRFLEVSPDSEAKDLQVVHNRSEETLAPRGLPWRLSRTAFYRSFIRPLISRPVRTRVRRLVQPSAPPRPAPPSLATIDYIIDETRSDIEGLVRLLGIQSPPWDLDVVRRRYSDKRNQSAD